MPPYLSPTNPSEFDDLWLSASPTLAGRLYPPFRQERTRTRNELLWTSLVMPSAEFDAMPCDGNEQGLPPHAHARLDSPIESIQFAQAHESPWARVKPAARWPLLHSLKRFGAAATKTRKTH